MADIPTLEPAPELADTTTAEAPKRSRRLLIIAVCVALVAAAGLGGWLFLAPSATKPKAAHHAEKVSSGPALYVSLDPPFVTNFQPNDVARFLQVSVEVMTHDKKTVALIKANNPVIRNNLLLLFGNQKYSDLESASGKEHLRAQALAAIRKVVASNGGDAQAVDAVYFTSFVMQ